MANMPYPKMHERGAHMCAQCAHARAHMNPVTRVTQAQGRQEEARKEESTGEERGREAEIITAPCPPS